MRAAQVITLDGPTAIEIRDVAEPEAQTIFGEQCVVDVHAVGVAFPDLLLSKGEYQMKPEPPFTLGTDYAGVVRSAPEGSGFKAGDRVAGVGLGGAAEVVGSSADMLFPLPDSLSFEKAAAMPMNYLTAQFALKTRAGLQPGETVLVHGAAGGVGTATIQVAKGYGAKSIAVVSTDEKADVALRAGADEVLRVEEFRETARTLGVDVVMDVVGGDLFTDSLRAMATFGRLLVVGFVGGAIPEVKVNRLLLGNIDVRGVLWGNYAMVRPGYMHAQWADLVPMIESGVTDPPVGDVLPLESIGQALVDLEERRTIAKTVLTLGR
jgi:NADPH:quinone reductase